MGNLSLTLTGLIVMTICRLVNEKDWFWLEKDDGAG